MKPFFRVLACVATIGVFNIAHTIRAQGISDLQINNPLAQRIVKRLLGKTQFDAWTVDVVGSRKNSYAIAATPSLPDSDAKRHALLGVNCINKAPSISVIFDGTRQQFSEPMSVLITSDNGAPQREIAMPMTGRDAIGVFGMRASMTVQSIRNANILTVFLPQTGRAWRFSLSGLAQTIIYMKNHCIFSAQDIIDKPEMTLIQVRLHQLGYNVPTNGEINNHMKEVIFKIQKKYGLKETGQIDDSTYDMILQIISE
jgi:hypothetical protein